MLLYKVFHLNKYNRTYNVKCICKNSDGSGEIAEAQAHLRQSILES